MCTIRLAKQRTAAAFQDARKSSPYGEWGHGERGGVRRSAPNMATDRLRHLRRLPSLVLADRVLQSSIGRRAPGRSARTLGTLRLFVGRPDEIANMTLATRHRRWLPMSYWRSLATTTARALAFPRLRQECGKVQRDSRVRCGPPIARLQ